MLRTIFTLKTLVILNKPLGASEESHGIRVSPPLSFRRKLFETILNVFDEHCIPSPILTYKDAFK